MQRAIEQPSKSDATVTLIIDRRAPEIHANSVEQGAFSHEPSHFTARKLGRRGTLLGQHEDEFDCVGDRAIRLLLEARVLEEQMP